MAGIYLPGEGTGPEGGLGIPWDNTIVLCLEDARELLGGEQVSQIRLELEDPKDARSLAAAVEETAEASPHQGSLWCRWTTARTCRWRAPWSAWCP